MMKYMMLKENLQLLQHLLQRDEQHQLALNKVKECLTVCVCVCVVAGLEVTDLSALWVTLKLVYMLTTTAHIMLLAQRTCATSVC